MCELPYAPAEWQEIGCVQYQPAEATDVGPGGAVFAQKPSPESVYSMRLPSAVIWIDEFGRQRAGVVTQAEPMSDETSGTVLGVVEPNGQNNVLMLGEGQVMAEPNSEWFQIAATYSSTTEAAQ